MQEHKAADYNPVSYTHLQYQTKQMAELLAFLKSVPGSHITVNDICDHFKKEGITVGMTTVYRHLERMRCV